MPYPARTTVGWFSLNQGTFQLKPTEGAKLLRSLPFKFVARLGLGEFLPTNCTCTRSVQVLVKPMVPGLDVHLTLLYTSVESPTMRAARPSGSPGLPYQAQCTPRFNAR